MGKSKAKVMTESKDGGFVPRQSSLVTRLNEEKKREDAWAALRTEALKRRMKENMRHIAQRKAEEKAASVRMQLIKEGRERRQKEFRQQQEEYDKPLPEFAPRVPHEVRGHFFQYVAHVVSDTLWNLRNPTYRDDPYGYEQENAAILGEEVPPKAAKPPRKKVPAECLKAAFRIAELKPFGTETRIRLQVVIDVFIDVSHPYFTTEDGVWLDSKHFDKRLCYRVQKNLGKNIPFFAPFDNQYFSPQQNDSVSAVFFRVYRVWDADFADLKKSGYLLPGEEKVVHLEIF